MARKSQFLTLSTLCLVVVLTAAIGHAQITPLGDSFTNTSDPTTNYGANILLDVDGATQIAYIRFNLASVPATASISQATLKLYVNGVTTAGSLNVDYVNGSWEESTIDASNAPALGTTIASDVSIITTDKNQYILINVTSAVQAWLDGSEANNGIALVANSTFDGTFDSKENTATSHPPELDIAFAGGIGTITGVTTASGSGLTGGGTTGTLPLGLTTACSSSQVLQWNGSAWACASTATGTITGVTAGSGLKGGGASGAVTLTNSGLLGLTAGTGISSTGGQSPTLSINASVVPELSSANTFTQNLSTSGELAAGGTASGDTAKGTVEVDAGGVNTGTYAPGLNFGGGGQSIASDRTGTVNIKGIDFYTNFDVRMSLTNGGDVGIGTTAPTHLFEVDAAASSAQMAMVSTGQDAAISMKNTATGGREYWIDSGSGASGIGAGNFGVWDATASAPRFVIDQFGDVGIGTTEPIGLSALLGVVSSGFESAAYFESDSESNPTLDVVQVNGDEDVFDALDAATARACTIDEYADLTCDGVVSGVVPVDGGARRLAVSAIASPKNWFEDAGSGHLVNGVAVITLDSDFIQTVNTDMEYQVFLTPYGDCKGLFVTNRTANSFEVHELGGGTAGVSFGYRIMALRKNYENVRFADRTAHWQKQRERAEQRKARKGSGQPLRPQSNPPLTPSSQHAELQPGVIQPGVK
jgi:hypothetical protein